MAPMLSPHPRTPRQLRHDPRPPSPNYFSLVIDSGDAAVISSGAKVAKSNWSPATCAVRSVAASSPQNMPRNANSEYEAFRRQSEHHGFNLSQENLCSPSVSAIASSKFAARPSASRNNSRKEPLSPRSMPTPGTSRTVGSSSISEMSREDRSPKRLLPVDSASALIFDRPRRESPASFAGNDLSRRTGSPPTKHDDKHPRFSLPHDAPMLPGGNRPQRADTLPEKLDNTSPVLASPQHVADILKSSPDHVLLLDLRVSTHYARSCIASALNLCIPTTLLKRASYDVKRLAETFKDDARKERFQKWPDCKYIVVYDANSTQLKEASNCINILKKFTMEKWEGQCIIIRGGFTDFSRKFPSLMEQGNDGGQSSPTPRMVIDSDKAIPPVIGGCPMPATKNAANPFFGNIRQNMDLIGGVGQMPVQYPAKMSKQNEHDLPFWLRQASDARNNGKEVSDKFLDIEKREQKRMQEALSGNVEYGAPDSSHKVQIAGIEKGSKNRYNNIWPYEHSRVKLQGVEANGCDYVNASFVRTSLSNKNYIATQGPIPATFSDFWNMVWQHDIRVMVMLTAESEGGQIKAHNYWDGKHYGLLKLQFLSEHRASLEMSKIHRQRERPDVGSRRSTNHSSTSSSGHGSIRNTEKSVPSPVEDEPYVIVRKFMLAHENHPFERMREITQLQYSSWPDFGAPAHPAHLLALVEQCDAVVRSTVVGHSKGPDLPSERPVLVHCSAGCGRTGTFCTVDSVVDMLKRQRSVRPLTRQGSPMDMDSDYGGSNPFFGQQAGTKKSSEIDRDWLVRDDLDLIEKTVEELRLQRLSMVQSLRQFVLCYETVLEWIIIQGQPKTD